MRLKRVYVFTDVNDSTVNVSKMSVTVVSVVRILRFFMFDMPRLNAAADARRRFDLRRQVAAHLNWYAAILADRATRPDPHVRHLSMAALDLLKPRDGVCR